MHNYVKRIVMSIICIIYVIYLSVVKIWRRKRERGFTLRGVFGHQHWNPRCGHMCLLRLARQRILDP